MFVTITCFPTDTTHVQDAACNEDMEIGRAITVSTGTCHVQTRGFIKTEHSTFRSS